MLLGLQTASNSYAESIREEIVANSTETFLNDEQFIRDICSGKNKSIGKRIVEWLTDVIDAFKEMISDRSFSRVADVLRQDVKNYEKTRQLWMDGIDEAAENMETQQYVGESFKTAECSTRRRLCETRQGFGRRSTAV